MAVFDAPSAAGTDSLQAAPAQPVVPYPYTGDYRIDTLLAGLEYRWNYPSALGTTVNVTYSFMMAAPIYGGTDDGDGDTGFEQFTTAQKDAVRTIFSHLQAELNVNFTEVADSSFSYGQIRFGDNYQKASA